MLFRSGVIIMKKKILITLAVVAVSALFGGIVVHAAVGSTFFADAQQTIQNIEGLFQKGNEYKENAELLEAQLTQKQTECKSLQDNIAQLQKDLQNKDVDLQARNEEIQKLQEKYQRKSQEVADLSEQLDLINQTDEQKDSKIAEIKKLSGDRLSQLSH